MPTTPQTLPLAVIFPGVNAAPGQAPNRDPNDSVSELTVFESSFWTNVAGVKSTPPVSWMRAVVYHPWGTDALHPVLRKGTGFSSKVIFSAAVACAGGGEGAAGWLEEEPQAASSSPAAAAAIDARVAVGRFAGTTRGTITAAPPRRRRTAIAADRTADSDPAPSGRCGASRTGS